MKTAFIIISVILSLGAYALLFVMHFSKGADPAADALYSEDPDSQNFYGGGDLQGSSDPEEWEVQEDYSNLVTVFISICLTILIVLFLSMAVRRTKRLIPHYLLGIIYTVIFVLNMPWVRGHVDRMFPGVEDLSGWLVFIIGCFGMFWIWGARHKDYPQVFKSRHLWSVCGSMAGWLAGRIYYLLTGNSEPLLCYLAVSFAYIIILFVKNVSRIMPDETVMFFTMETGVLCLIIGSLFNNIFLSVNAAAWMTVIIPAFLFIHIMCVSIVFMINDYLQAKKLENQLQLEQDMHRMQAALLASRMKPHFLYNTMTAIQELCYTQPERAAELIVNFSNYLRASIDFMDYKDTVAFEMEQEFIDNYMLIQKERFGTDLVYSENISYKDFKLPPFTIQPVIENAIKYGVRSSRGKGEVSLSVDKEPAGVYIRVKNRGEKLTEDMLKENHSISNIRKRLQASVNGRLDLEYDEEEGMVTVVMNIPL